MWLFMMTCYVLSVFTFLLLCLSGLQGYFNFSILNANHPTFALLSVIVYLLTETLVIFFFVGVSSSIKDYTLLKKLDMGFYQRVAAIKRKIYPPTFLNILLVMGQAISGGAVSVGQWPKWCHGLLFFLCLLHLGKVFQTQHNSFKTAASIMLAIPKENLNS